ncbi:MAG: hypothetical protein NXI04_03355 [Planctomycetaceae bacterium]|nr:hypothetical protein [Planctomycetaceae bacterium]
MPETEHTWLRHWHNILDAEVGPDPNFDFEEACEEPDEDFRMHFVTWELSDDGLRQCFEVLPHGPQLADRAIEMRSLHRAESQPLSEEDARELFRTGIEAVGRFSDDADLAKSIRTMRVSKEDLSTATSTCDRVAVVLEDVNWNAAPENKTASSFLNETLYQLAQSYDVADHVAWPLFGDPESVELYLPFATLALSGIYFPLLDEDGPVLFIMANEEE